MLVRLFGMLVTFEDTVCHSSMPRAQIRAKIKNFVLDKNSDMGNCHVVSIEYVYCALIGQFHESH